MTKIELLKVLVLIEHQSAGYDYLSRLGVINAHARQALGLPLDDNAKRVVGSSK